MTKCLFFVAFAAEIPWQIAASFGFWPRNLTGVPKPVLSKKLCSAIFYSCSFPVLNVLSWVVMGWIADRPGLKQEHTHFAKSVYVQGRKKNWMFYGVFIT